MNFIPKIPDDPAIGCAEAEQRRQPRMYDPFPTTARCVDADGKGFNIDTVLDNFSAGGLYLRLPQRIEPGGKVFAVVRLTTAAAPEAPAPLIAVRGVVLRVDPTPEGGCGIAVRFTRHRFL